MKSHHIAILAFVVCALAAWMADHTRWLATMVLTGGAGFTMMHHAVRNIIRISYRKRLYDEPGGRHIHTTPIPRLGGIAFAPIICCVTIMGLALHEAVAPAHHGVIPDCLAWISALIFIHLIGAVDDMAGVRYTAKFAAQVVAGLLVAASGFWINDLGGLFGVHAIPAAVGIPLTVLFIVGVINALNLIDGMDGLAAGVCSIALAVYGAVSLAAGWPFFALVAFATLGTLAPFFWSNIRGVGSRRHKLFMGDTGSQTLGLVVAVLAVGQIMNSGTVVAQSRFVLALSPLVVPMFDVVHVVIFRVARGASPFRPDTSHIHHRLARWGLAPRGAVVAILALSAVFTAMNAALVGHIGTTAILIADVALWMALNCAVRVTGRENGKIRYTGRERQKRENKMGNKAVEHKLNF